MTSLEPMTRKELLELAALDVLGLLDEYEAAYYTRSFHHAPASVQDEIKRIQAEVASDESLLPGEEPDPSLRERVLAVVAKAIERETSKLAPLATIGRTRHAPADGDSRFPLPASGQFWRAACFALAGITLVFAMFYVRAQHYGNRVSEIALINNTDEILEELIGPTYKDFLFDPDTVHIVLTASSEAPGTKAVVCLNERTNQAFLITDGLPQAGTGAYTLSVAESAGDDSRKDLRRFASNGGVQGFALGTIAVAYLATANWQIVNSTGQVILTSA